MRHKIGISDYHLTFFFFFLLQTFFDVTRTVFGKEEGNILNNPTLKPGRHSFGFSYRLPDVLPHSFDAGSAAKDIGGVAHIRYTALARVDVPFGTDLVSDRLEFYIEGLFDVNQVDGKKLETKIFVQRCLQSLHRCRQIMH